ncbi:MAG: radical SAM protein [Nitrospirae bacterium]|nr:radical SAM protein [Nitrospirota bacterium]
MVKQLKSVNIIENQERISNRNLLLTAPLKAFFVLTDYCNIKCIHCSMDCGPGKNTHLPHKDIVSLLKQLIELGIFEIALNGGEPVLHPDFFNIVQTIKDTCQYRTVCDTENLLIISFSSSRKIDWYQK